MGYQTGLGLPELVLSCQFVTGYHNRFVLQQKSDIVQCSGYFTYNISWLSAMPSAQELPLPEKELKIISKR
jgi:hypothetical protein